MLPIWPNWWEDWNLYHKVTFDGVAKLIICNPGETQINVKEDIYSAWKEWVLIRDHSKFPEAIRNVGGDPITEILSLGATFFLMNGWRIRPAEESYDLYINGNLYVNEGGSPFVDTLGEWNVKIISTVSNLIDTINLGANAAAEVWGHQLEGLYTAKEIMRLMASALAGKISGAEGTNVKIRDLNDTTDRIDATVDSNGNRLSIIYDKD